MGHDKWQFQIPVAVLAKRAPIGGDHVERDASAALEELKTPVLVRGRRVRFLGHYEWSGPDGARVLTVFFEGRTPLRALRDRIRGGAAAPAGDEDQDDEQGE
jgi:hypothetical protein